jgi:VIT1/CCC1 family predicted Fe2+/Mn2+ transporter
VPLSEHEQKILQEIEKGLYHEDPGFARGVGKPRLSEGTRARLGVVFFFSGFVSLVAFFFTSSVVFGVIAFGAMVGGLVLLASFLKATLSDGQSIHKRLHDAFGQWEKRARDRYRRD